MRLRTVVIIGVVLAAVAYVAVYRRGAVAKTAKGFKPADTPQVAADMFKKAVQEREYEIAADYCTAGYAEQLRRGATAANELAVALDDLTYQLNERGLVRDEVKLALQALDPFPKDVTIVVSEASGETARGTITFGVPPLRGDNPSSGSWQLDPRVFQAYARSLPFVRPGVVVAPMRKEKDGWKFDFPADSALQLRVGRLNEKAKNYVNPLDVVKQEVKSDPTTKENVTNRLKSLLEQAARE